MCNKLLSIDAEQGTVQRSRNERTHNNLLHRSFSAQDFQSYYIVHRGSKTTQILIIRKWVSCHTSFILICYMGEWLRQRSWCMIKIFRGGSRGGDTFKTPSPPPYEQLLPLPTPFFEMFLERSLNDPPPPHFKHLSLLPLTPSTTPSPPPKNFDHTPTIKPHDPNAFTKPCNP